MEKIENSEFDTAKILVLNCGSSSIKYRLYVMPGNMDIAHGQIERIGDGDSQASQLANGQELVVRRPISDHQAGLELLVKMLTDPEKGAINSLTEISACGHRVVHGGEAISGSVIIDTDLEALIEDYFDLAPLHNPPNLMGIHAAKQMFVDIPQVACFDTAFHQSLPEKAYLYALPYDMYANLRIRRYGFHGTSHRYVSRRAATLMGKGKYDVNLITCHLGNGCSVAAIQDGKSVDTSMGMTPLEGLVMGTRTGDLDPGITFYLYRKGFHEKELSRLFNKKSGLQGISGLSNDVRDLEIKASNGNSRAELALEIFAYRVRKFIGAYMAVLDGVDGIV
ncbi:MAG: acetate kinase, partial [Candidatus Marinimicrobia bacterium]|nr:acetate kinase [Candidatus Neomarinimicrobiota bacterium]